MRIKGIFKIDYPINYLINYEVSNKCLRMRTIFIGEDNEVLLYRNYGN